jgi:hypothetical protein
MILAFGEDGMIEVLPDLAEAKRQWEPIDVESRAVVFYAEDGTYLEPVFTTPNKTSLFGLVLTQGQYDLVRSEAAPPEIDPIEIALDEAAGVEPNPHFDSVEAVRRHVAACRTNRR